MHVDDALITRRSTRAFTDQAVSDEEIRTLLTLAVAAPSWSNTQPYQIAFATGAKCERVRADYLDAIRTLAAEPDVPLLFSPPPGLKERKKACGVGLYETLGITRDDAMGRAAQFERNYAFFGAPAVVFFFAHTAFAGHAALDVGCLVQSFLLAATAAGLSTCAQASLASHPQVVRKHFAVDDAMALYCGVAVGHADAAAVVNGYQPARLPLDAVLAAAKPVVD